MKNKRKKALCLLLALLCAFQLLTVFCVTAFAEGETAAQSGVLEDLQRDPDFNVADYPEDQADYSLQIIQVAESINNGLVVYVYRPAGTDNIKHRAVMINMSTSFVDEKDPTFSRYFLNFLDSDGVFEKYEVADFSVSSGDVRYYNIAAIHRSFDASVDDNENKSEDDTSTYKGFLVGKCWEAYYDSTGIVYQVHQAQYVDVEIVAVGSLGYDGGFLTMTSQCHSHFVGFRVENFNVNKIYDATVIYSYRDHSVGTFSGEEYSPPLDEDPITVEKDLYSSDEVTFSGGGIFGAEYTWKRIVTKDEFIKQVEDNTNEPVYVKDGINSAQFVFQFTETNYTVTSVDGLLNIIASSIEETAE